MLCTVRLSVCRCSHDIAKRNAYCVIVFLYTEGVTFLSSEFTLVVPIGETLGEGSRTYGVTHTHTHHSLDHSELMEFRHFLCYSLVPLFLLSVQPHESIGFVSSEGRQKCGILHKY